MTPEQWAENAVSTMGVFRSKFTLGVLADMFAQAIGEEREACAKLVEQRANQATDAWAYILCDCSGEIRDRGKEPQ